MPTERNSRLAGYARQMRNEPTEPEKRLWTNLKGAQVNGLKFRRQASISPYVVDFLCPRLRLVIEVDGETHDVDTDLPRDTELEAQGYSVLHVTNRDVMTDIEGVLELIAARASELTDRFPKRRDPTPGPSPEGEG